MLSALDLARRIEACELTPRAVVDMCAEAIAARDKEVGAFVVLDLVAARQAAGSRSGSRTFSIPPISRPNTARRSMPASNHAPMPPRWR
jgi:Asp-tRNA(Asn)/Glu-tRNA(Gln) amidotransferase A subunit family amidase